ncbi:tail fiber protein [Jiulongibacter sediminis]|uniref:Phage tail collar domain-containing protein n=1 Tax=Jiulongibacter sediminis TaxID=1605367 RepID=A0A0P7BJN4_9BACT|nr:tail fiber protein [Jiulongibacter sediminis]KPM47419.1 hypothetical protein AFM12_14800 [Jiulongibacter sediminis]TBX22999.1 hypothetical protein TK44_14810 [Jiulongibacter sediminis]
MKNIACLLLFVFCGQLTFGQINMYNVDSDPYSSALFEVNSTDRGILIPRMSSTARDSIVAPVEGLLVYDSTYHSFWYYKDETWTEIQTIPDDLGNHVAEQNIEMGGFYVSGDGDNEGIKIDSNGNTTLSGNLTVHNAYTLPDIDGNATQLLSTDGAGGLSWTDSDSPFKSENGLIRQKDTNNDFLVGYHSLDYISSNSDSEQKMFFDKSKGAFRAGIAVDDSWDEANLGKTSFGFGVSSLASAEHSIAMGNKNNASAVNAIAIGFENTSSGTNAVSFGQRNTASGNYSTAFGYSSQASASDAVAFGYDATASGNNSIAGGYQAKATGSSALAFGYLANASSTGATAVGRSNNASGQYSFAGGYNTLANSYGENAFGMFNENIAANSTSSFNSGDRVFSIGNGSSTSNRSDAVVVYKSGDTEINGALTIDNAYTLPTTDGDDGEVLTTDGNGNLSWEPAIPIGTIQMWPTSSAPSGWLLCNGSSFSSGTYPDLASVLGGSTLPDFTGRFPLGSGNSGENGSTNHSLGSDGGEETHTLTINEMPSHNHGITYSGKSKSGSGGEVSDLENNASTVNTTNTGGGNAHNNMPPFYTINFIIKAK